MTEREYPRQMMTARDKTADEGEEEEEEEEEDVFFFFVRTIRGNHCFQCRNKACIDTINKLQMEPISPRKEACTGSHEAHFEQLEEACLVGHCLTQTHQNDSFALTFVLILIGVQ